MSSAKQNQKSSKIFGIRQQVISPAKVQEFLHILLQDPPTTSRRLEQQKYRFAAEHKVSTIQNRDLTQARYGTGGAGVQG